MSVQNIVLSVPVIDSSRIDPYLHFCGVSRDTALNCLDNEFAQRDNKIWRKQIKIQSNGAKEIKIVFRKFVLSPNAIVSFYTDSLRYQYQGAYFVHKPDSSFISDFLNGEHCTIAIEIPMDEFDQNQILISQIKHFTESFEDAVRGNDYSCLIDVNCSEGNDWCDQKRSVAIYYFTQNGIDYLCTGALVNNYQNNFVQYFLTARHCTNKTIDWANTEFYFNYQKPSCNSGNGYEHDYYRVQGSQLVAYCDVSWSDNAILRITEPIPLQANVYYAGVDITARSIGNKVTIIHHPHGMPKKITSGKLQNFAGPRWEIYWDNGNTFPGSSGAPIFLNNNQRVIANNASSTPGFDCSNNYRQSWVGKVRSCNDIEDILFGNSGLESYAGIDPNRDCQSTLHLQGEFHSTQEYDATLDGLTIQAGNTITVSNAVFDSLSNYTLTAGSSIVFLPGTKIESGSHFVAKIEPCSGNLVSCGTHSAKVMMKSLENGEEIEKELYIAVEDEEEEQPLEESKTIDEKPQVYPNPTTGLLTIDTKNGNSHIQTVELYNTQGAKQFTFNGNHDSFQEIDISHLPSQVYVLKVHVNEQVFTKKLILQK
jgi:V8-like Glu-specific endopeptidase